MNNNQATPVLFAETGRQLLPRGACGAGGGRLEVVVGAGVAGAAVAIDLGTGPVLVTGPAGSGRTTTARLLAAQALRARATCSIIDHRGAHVGWVTAGGAQVPAIEAELWQSTAETRVGLVGVARLCDRRHALADLCQTARPVGDELHVVVVEDLGQLARDLGPGSRAARALDELICGGRSVGLAVIATAGPRRSPSLPWIAEQFPTHIAHQPGRRRGRVEVTDTTGATRPAQVVYMTDPEANAWAAGAPIEATPGRTGCCTAGAPLRCDDCGRCIGICECPSEAQLDEAARAADEPAPPGLHRCVDHLDYIGGWPPYECVVCGKRLSHLDIADGDQP